MVANTINELITLLDQIDRDAKTLEYISNDPATSTLNGVGPGLVTTRLGSSVKNVQKVIADVEDGLIAGIRPDIQSSGDLVLSSPSAINFEGKNVSIDTTGSTANINISNNGIVNVDFYGARGDGVTDDTLAIVAAYEALVFHGGGILYFPPGVYIIGNSNLLAATWDNKVGLWIKHNNIHIVGAGIGATVLKLKAAGNSHVVSFGQRAAGTIVVNDCSIQSLTIDGSRSSQSIPTDSDDHWAGINVSSDCTNITLRDLEIINCVYYGIGFQRKGHIGCTVDNVRILNTGADGIDCKNDNNTSNSNTITNVRVENFGLLTTLAEAQAGIDLRSGWSLTNGRVFFSAAVTTGVGIRTLRDEELTDAQLPAYHTIISDVQVSGRNQAGIGIQLNVRGMALTNAMVKSCNVGISGRSVDLFLTNPQVIACGTGISLGPHPEGLVEADSSAIFGGMIRLVSGTSLLIDSIDELTVSGLHVRQGTGGASVGINITSGSSNIQVIGGSCTGHITSLIDNGVGTILRDVVGIRTFSRRTQSVVVGTTGVKTITVAHGLSVTPVIHSVSLNIVKVTNVTDWAYSNFMVTAVDSTNITAQLTVSTASATVGATVDVVVTVQEKMNP